MPVRVLIEINGEVVGTMKIRNVGPTSKAEGEDPEGARNYEAEIWTQGMRGFAHTKVPHRRGDGVLALVRRVLQQMDRGMGQ